MNLVIFVHPGFMGSQSMPRYANMLAEGLRQRSHKVEICSASKLLYRFPAPTKIKKWLGYFDQFIVFPIIFRLNLKKYPSNTLFVFADHALGPWIWLVKKRPFVVHCHDFLAQRSALGEIPENRTNFSGKVYQKWIKKGYSQGNNFISVSKKTQKDLHQFLKSRPRLTRVIYNGMNQEFSPGDPTKVRRILSDRLQIFLDNGYILHVGGNQFYKNRKGVILIYTAWRERNNGSLPLLMIGAQPTDELKQLKEKRYSSEIHFLMNVSDEILKLAYQGATALLFPSLEEGFGWPIAEAMASGCPVITTNKEPMNEVGGKSCFYIPCCPADSDLKVEWSKVCAQTLNELVALSGEAQQNLISSGIENAKRFNTEKSLDEIESVYKEVLQNFEE